MRKEIALVLLCLLSMLSFGQQTEKTVLYFDYAKYELSQPSKSTLDDLCDWLKTKDIIQIEINGHTDSDGSDSYNKTLSQNRSASVRKHLVMKGIPKAKIRCNHFGESQPIATNDHELGKQKNRRVEIIIQFKDKAESASNTTTASTEDMVSEKGLAQASPHSFSVNRAYVQTFKASTTEKIVIKGEKGTSISIPANSLVDQQGNAVRGEVTIELIEVYTKSDMILHKIQTASNGQLLETGGMVYIRAISKNGQVHVKDKAFYTIEFPTKDKQGDMLIFYGDTTDRDINWQLVDDRFRSEREFVKKNEQTEVVVFDVDTTDFDINWQQTANGFRSGNTILENIEKLDGYIFNLTEFGWINCDRFIYQTPKTDITVNTSDTLGVHFCLVFKSIKSVLNVSDRNGVIKFSGVPVGQRATLVAFKRTSTETFYASQTVTLLKNLSVTIEMEKMTDAEFKNRIKEFD